MNYPKDELLEAPTKTRESLQEKYLRIRTWTEKLCQPLEPEDFVAQPVVDVSPPKWHLAHTTWFFEQFVLVPNKKDYKVFNEDYAFMFNSYYETVGERVMRPDRGNMTRPGTKPILHYRKYVDEQIIEFLNNGSVKKELKETIELGLNHEQQHQELLITDLKYILGHNPLFPEYRNDLKPAGKGSKGKVSKGYYEVNDGLYHIGYRGKNFHFDNEEGHHKEFVRAFKARKQLVTNREYLEFIKDGGYENFRWWLSEGWDWVQKHNITAPEYWHQIDNKWYQFTLSGLKMINLDDPVNHVSFFEAEAFAQWKGMRLLKEAEWEVLCKKFGKLNADSVFMESEYYNPVANPTNDLYGNVWEWTYSAYTPYPGFKTKEGAIGEYNGKFMINQMVLRGGSCATARDHIRATYRNFFHPHLRWQFTGIRLAK